MRNMESHCNDCSLQFILFKAFSLLASCSFARTAQRIGTIMCSQDLKFLLFSLAGQDGAETAEELIKQFEAHDVLQIRDLVGLQLYDCDGIFGGTHSFYWEPEAMRREVSLHFIKGAFLVVFMLHAGQGIGEESDCQIRQCRKDRSAAQEVQDACMRYIRASFKRV